MAATMATAAAMLNMAALALEAGPGAGTGVGAGPGGGMREAGTKTVSITKAYCPGHMPTSDL